MKNLLLLLLFVPLVGFGQEITRGQIIDKGLKKIQTFLPYDFNNGVVWTKAINEDDLSRVFIYQVSAEGIPLVNENISKTWLIKESKAADAYKIAKNNKINCIWRYYHKKLLIKEVIVYPSDW